MYKISHYLRVKPLPFQRLFIALLSIILSACGGSSDNNSQIPNIPTPSAKDIINNDINFDINQTIDLSLYYPGAQISNILWRQTSGKTVSFLAGTSKTIAFTPTSIDDYSFEVTFNADGGISQTLDYTFTTTQGSNLINVRLGHAVKEGNKVSLRSEILEEIDPSTLVWQQLSGPSITFTEDDVTGALAVFFDAPAVDEDTMLSFQVTGTVSGVSYSSIVSVLVENAQTIEENAYFKDRLANTFAYKTNSPYSEQLVDCVYTNNLSSSCTLGVLPLIAQDSASPSVADIMDRVVVSHHWMGARFEQFLQNNDPNNDFKNLLRATTAIVISYDIRPSFYWAATGAIYLDPNNFWLTPDERDTINQAPDYRAAFGNELQFVMPWRYVKDNIDTRSSVPANLRISRQPEDGLYRLASVIYHELAHANDFIPKSEWFSHSSDTRVLDAALSTNFESDKLAVALPLNGNEIRALAQVSFAGKSATTTQKSYLPSDIENFFSPEHANDFYNYSSLREDYAMLFEAILMQTRYGVIRDVAITNQPMGDNITASDYIIQWGERGRIGQDNIKPRVAFVASRVLPEFDYNSAINQLPQVIEMEQGSNWVESLTISPSPRQSAKKERNLFNNNSIYDLPVQTRYFHKDLPESN